MRRAIVVGHYISNNFFNAQTAVHNKMEVEDEVKTLGLKLEV